MKERRISPVQQQQQQQNCPVFPVIFSKNVQLTVSLETKAIK